MLKEKKNKYFGRLSFRNVFGGTERALPIHCILCSVALTNDREPKVRDHDPDPAATATVAAASAAAKRPF